MTESSPGPVTLAARAVILTGATRGIGRATALRLAREKVRLALCGRDAAALESVAEETRALSGEDVFVRAFDLADAVAVAEFYSAARKALGVPDILVNNAGYNERKAPILDATTEEFDRMVAVNLRAPFILAREAARDMAARKSGHIVNVLSTVCHFANETMGIYTATKRGLEGLSGVLLKEVRPHGVRVSAVYPGGTDTSFRPKSRPDYLRPESVAEAIVAVLTMPEDLVIHGLTFRPMVETNF
jgi:short-subunit dehydrogenase